MTDFDKWLKTLDGNEAFDIEDDIDFYQFCEMAFNARTPDKALQALREIYEVWAGLEGFVASTGNETYMKRVIEEMRDIAAEALRVEK